YILIARPGREAAESAAKFAAVMEQVIATYGSDPNAKDVSRVLRLPGFYHQKDDKPPTMVRIRQIDGQRYDWDTLTYAFQCMPDVATMSVHLSNLVPTPRESFEDRPREWRMHALAAL